MNTTHLDAAKTDDAPTTDPVATPKLERPRREGLLEEVRVLIVDDDQDVRESIDAAFQAEGALTIALGDGNSAVEVVLDDPPDLVILDMMLPGRSGFLALERIKGYPDSPLVIMVTANEGKRHQAYAERLGVDAYMLKPVPLGRLIDEAVRLLDEDDREFEDEDDGSEE